MIDAEGKRFRVSCWLDSLAACADRLASVRAAMAVLYDGYDGIGAMRYDRPHVRGGSVKGDRIGDLVADREERAAQLSEEADMLAEAVGNAERAIRDAWKSNEGAADGAFRYIVERYVHGAPEADAVRAAGVGRYAAKISVRRAAGMIYDEHPEIFAREPGRWTDYYGYDQAILGVHHPGCGGGAAR